MPLISVVVPCYNYARFLPETLESLLRQTYQDWECIMVDDGSTDHTQQVAGAYVEKDSRFKYLYQHNAGTSSAKNTGIRAATGEYIQLLDADDLLEPGKLAVQAGFLEKHKDVDVVYTYAKLVETDKEGRWLPARTEVQKRVFSTDGTLMLQEFCSLPVFAINAPLLRRRVFDKVGYFDVELDSYEDWQFWLRCAVEECRFAYLEAETASVVIRKHDVSKKRRADFDNEIRIRKWLGKLAVGNKARSINKRNEILLRIKFYRSHNLPFLSFYWALRYFASFPPTSWTEGKIFLGELLFPSVYLRTKKMIGG